MSSVLCHLAQPWLHPPIPHSGSGEQLMEARETTGRALKYIAAGCGHMSLVSTGKPRAHNHHNTADKNSCPLIPRPRIQILATKLCVVLVKNTNWSIDLSRVSVPLPHSGWRVFYLFHEFPFILSRTEPSRAELTDPDLGSST